MAETNSSHIQLEMVKHLYAVVAQKKIIFNGVFYLFSSKEVRLDN